MIKRIQRSRRYKTRTVWCKRPDKPPIIEKLNDRKKKGHQPQYEILKEILATMIWWFSSIYIIIDALDECPNEYGLLKRERLLETLRELHNEKFSNVHLMCTSHSQQDIEAALKSLMSPTVIGIDLDTISLMKKDMRLYLDQVSATRGYKS
jgi:hypothetical protein